MKSQIIQTHIYFYTNICFAYKENSKLSYLSDYWKSGHDNIEFLHILCVYYKKQSKIGTKSKRILNEKKINLKFDRYFIISYNTRQN